MAKYIAWAIPVFLLFIAVEVIVNLRQGNARYRLHDTITNLNCGVGQQLLGFGFGAVVFLMYGYMAQNWALWEIPTATWSWVCLLFGVDLGYYCFHRAAHRINFLWATHAVHHQSEEYNYSVALRQSWFAACFAWFFYAPLVLIGFSPIAVLTVRTVNTLYQFWPHTRTIGKLGPLEWIINTPSHHRVHHAINPKYIDKNYAGMFIIWDRLFGTFTEEQEEPTYGTVEPLANWSPLWANLKYWGHVAALSRSFTSFGDKLSIWFRPPEWRPTTLGGDVEIPATSRTEQKRYHTTVPQGLNTYVAVHFLTAIPIIMWLLLNFKTLPIEVLGGILVIFFVGMEAWAGLFQGRSWAVTLEFARLALMGAGGVGWAHVAGMPPLVLAVIALLAVGMGVWVARYRDQIEVGFVSDSV